MSSTVPLVTLGAALGRVTCSIHMMRRASMRTEALAEVADGQRAVMELLLT